MRHGTKRLVLLLFASAPLSWLWLFGSYVLRARLALGYWPLPYRPDPHELGFHVHHMAVVLGWPASLFLALIACVWAWLPSSGVRAWAWAASVSVLALFSTGATIAFARANPGHLFVWFMD